MINKVIHVEVVGTDESVQEINQVNEAFERAEQSAESYSNETQKLTQSKQKLGKEVKANTMPAMQEFSRVVQDAPYGIQGVANNIQQLTANFGHLSTQSGGARAALKGMFASLIGPSGILLGVSLVTAALVQWGEQIFSTTKKQEDLDEAIKASNESIKMYAKNLVTLANLQKLIGKDESAAITASGKARVAYLNQLRKERDDLAKEYDEVADRLREQSYFPFFGPSEDDDVERIDEIRKRVGELTGIIRTELVKGQKEIEEVVIETSKGKAIIDRTEETIEDIASGWGKVFGEDGMFGDFVRQQIDMEHLLTDAVKEGAEERNRIRQIEADARVQTQYEYIDSLNSLGRVLGSFAEDNKALAVAALLAQQIAAVANVIVSGIQARSGVVAQAAIAGGAVGVAAVAPLLLAMKIADGIGVAAIIASTVGAVGQIGGGSGSGSSSSVSSGGSSAPAPSFNVVGASQSSSLEQTLLSQGVRVSQDTPIQTYVVGSQVTSQQNLDRQIEANAGVV